MSFALPPQMADKPETPEPFSLKRWSQRKRAAARVAPADPVLPPAPDAPAPAAQVAAESAPAPIDEPAPLPPVASLTFESDYSAFMQPKVAEETRRAALRKLFSDPSFNVMDGLDIYVGDYTQADPMPAGMLEKLSAVYAMLDPIEPPRAEPAVAAGPDSASGAAPEAVAESEADVVTDPRPAPAADATAAASEACATPAPGTRTA